MATKTEIFNMALIHLGHSVLADDVDTDETKEATLGRLVWDTAVRYVLRAAPWQFATSYQSPDLVDGSQADPVNGDWTYEFLYPTDGVSVRRIVTPAGRKETNPPQFKIGAGITNPEADPSDQVRGKLIFTSYDEEIEIEYTLLITDPEEFEADFIEALALYLAYKLAMPVSEIEGMAEKCFAAFRLSLAVADAQDGNEEQEEQPQEAEWIRNR